MASYHNSPTYPPKTLSSTSYYPPNSPTSTMLPPLPSFVGSYHHPQQYHQSDRARRSASTRPALNEMRKIMKDFKNNESTVDPPSSICNSDTHATPTAAANAVSVLPCAKGLDGMYLDTLHKLHESMLRSERTRPSLSMQATSTTTTQRQQEHEYEHNQQRVSQIIDSVQTSSYDVNMCLQSVIYQQQQQHQQQQQ